MKEAMWGVGLIMLAIFGILLINLFGSITVTNQQDYTAMKNTVEAAMYDAIDDGLYRSGFCVCTNMERDKNGIYTFNTSSDYEIGSLKEGICYPKENSLMTSCEPIEGEYNYGLRYDEFISPMIKVIQDQENRIESLESEVKELKDLVNKLLKK